MDKKIINDPPGGKINLPTSSSAIVTSGRALLTNALTPPLGSPITLLALSNLIRGFGNGQRAVLAGVTNSDISGHPGGF